MVPFLFPRKKSASPEIVEATNKASETLRQYLHSLELAERNYSKNSVLFRNSDKEKLFNLRANELAKMAQRTTGTDDERIAQLKFFNEALQAANELLANTQKLKEVCDTLDIGTYLDNSEDPVIQQVNKQVVPTGQKVHADILSLAHDLLNKPSLHKTAYDKAHFQFLSTVTQNTQNAVSSPEDSRNIRPLLNNIETLNDNAEFDAHTKKVRYQLRGTLVALAGGCLAIAGIAATITGVGLPVGLAMIGVGASLYFVGLLAIRAGRKQEVQKGKLQSQLEVLIKQTEKLLPPEKKKEETLMEARHQPVAILRSHSR